MSFFRTKTHPGFWKHHRCSPSVKLLKPSLFLTWIYNTNSIPISECACSLPSGLNHSLSDLWRNVGMWGEERLWPRQWGTEGGNGPNGQAIPHHTNLPNGQRLPTPLLTIKVCFRNVHSSTRNFLCKKVPYMHHCNYINNYINNRKWATHASQKKNSK